MNKIGLIYGYSAKNAGDLAITLGALDHLTEKNDNIYIVSRYSKEDEEYLESRKYYKQRYGNIEVVGSPFSLDRNLSFLKKIWDHLLGFLIIIGLIRKNNFRYLINNSEKIYFNGGNLLRCESFVDLARLLALMYPLFLAKRFKVPYVILPQSTAKLNKLGRIVLKPILKSAEVTYCREEISYNLLNKYFPEANIRLNTDMAFFIDSKYNKANVVEIDEANPIVAITTRSQTIGDIYELTNEEKSRILEELKLVVDNLIAEGCEVCFVVQTKKDYQFTVELYNSFKGNSKVNFYEEYDPIKLVKFYSECDLLFGMRLHSIILALSAGTPCVGYFDKTWGFKNPGIMNTFNLPYFFVHENNLDYNVIKNTLKFDRERILDVIRGKKIDLKI